MPAASATNGQSLAECARFASGNSWGSVRKADVRLAGEIAPGIEVQIIADASLPTAPSDCSEGASPTDAKTLLANGILGIGHAVGDCRSSVCPAAGGVATYYRCAGGVCTGTPIPTNQQVSNPVAAFASDNNGTVIHLPSVGANGALQVEGTLIFGIGTQADNAIGSATVQTIDPVNFTFLTTFASRQYIAFIDSGSMFYTFNDSLISRCNDVPRFYCPGATLSLTATSTGLNGAMVQVNFSVADADALAISAGDAEALDNVAVTSPGGSTLVDGTFDWGLPFFFGRKVFTAIEGRMAAGTVGPWVAYSQMD